MFKRKSVLYTWCLSYGLLLLMMVVMCIMLGRNARNQLISEYKIYYADAAKAEQQRDQ